MSSRVHRRVHPVAVVLACATMLSSFAGLSLAVPNASAAQSSAPPARSKVSLAGGDLVDIAANGSGKTLVLAARAEGSSNVADPASTLLTINQASVGQDVSASFDATSVSPNLPTGARAGDVTLTLVDAATPSTGGVQASDSNGKVVLGSAPADPKSVTIPASNSRITNKWIFNAQGRFALTFRASAQVTDKAGKTTAWTSPDTTYLVQAGDPVKPTVTLTTTTPQVDSGTDVPLTAVLDDSQAAGSMSFKDGDKELGTVAVKDGVAAYTAKSLSDGKHSIVAVFTPADSTEYAASSSQPAAVRVGEAGKVKVLDSGSLMITPKLSTDQDTSECAATQKCKPTKLTAGLVDRTIVDSNIQATKDKPWDRQQWYAADNVVIHVPQRVNGYTLPTTVNSAGKDMNSIAVPTANYVKGTDPLQSVVDYLHNAGPNNLLLGQSLSIGLSPTSPAGINSNIFYKSYRSHSLNFRNLTKRPDNGVLTTYAAATMPNGKTNVFVDWNSSKNKSDQQAWLVGLSAVNPTQSQLAQWSFSEPGVYCVPIQTIETIKADDGDSAHDTKISATGTYAFVVGDTVDAGTVTPCDQMPDAGTGDEPTVVPTNLINDGGHHDIRIYRPAGQNKFTFGMDAAGETDSARQLSNIVWTNPLGPTTVSNPPNYLTSNIGPVGTKYWYFPTASDTSPWPGFSAESLKVSDFQSPITWRFMGFSRDGVANPADTTVIMQTNGGLDKSDWNSRRGFPTAFQGQPLTHFHPMWAFTKPGVYCIATEATAKTNDAGWISGSGQITMVVGTHADDPNIPEDLQTVTPCERNGKPAPVAETKSVLPETTTNDVVSSLTAGQFDKDVLVNIGWDANGNLNQRADVAKSVGDMLSNPVTTDPGNVIYPAPYFDQRDAAWEIQSFALDTTTMQPSSLKDGTVKVTLDDGVKGPAGSEVRAENVANWPSPMQLSSAPGGQRSFDMVAQDSTMDAGLWWSFSKSGVYCVPVTVSATSVDGTTHSSEKTYTFIAGNTTNPKGADYVDASKVTTCSRGQNGKGAENASSHNGDSTVSHADIYVPNESKTDSGAVILNQGHVDIASKLNGSTFQTWVKDSTNVDGHVRWQPLAYSNANKDPIRGQPPVTTNGETDEYTTSKGVVFQAFPDSMTTVPAESKWGFLGKAGSEIYQLPQVQDPNLLWAGWSTQAMTPDQTKTGVQWTLNKLQMLDGKNPTGQFSIYESDTFGNPSVLFHANGANVDRNTFTISKNAHVHANWSFGGQGTYCMAFTRATELPDGHEVQDAFTLAVAVGAVNVRKVDPYQCFNGKAQQASSAPIGTSASNSGKPATVTSTNKTRQLDACTATSTLTSQAAQTKTILSFGHMDYNAQIRNGQLRSYIGDDSTGQRIYRDPATTVLWLKPESQVTIPGGYESVAPGGTPVWQIPQTQNPDLVWLGWSTELLNAGLASSPVDWELTAVDGPGTVKVYTTGSFGGVEQMVFDGPGSHTIALGSHVHANWAFSQQGVYRLHFTESVRLANGAMSSDSEVLTVVVGNVDPTAVASAGGGTTSAVVGNNCGGLSTAALKIPTVNPANAQSAGGQTKVLPSEGLGSSASSHKNSAEQADMTAVRMLEVAIGVLLVGGVLGAGVLWRRQLGLKALIAAAGLH